MLRITFAVFLPTPGRDSNAGLVLGTLELCSSINLVQVFIILVAFELNRPIRCMYVLSLLRPRVFIASGVFATENKGPVALFTLTSVDCADNMTAISNSNVDL